MNGSKSGGTTPKRKAAALSVVAETAMPRGRDIGTEALTPGNRVWAEEVSRYVREVVKTTRRDVLTLPRLCRDFRQHRVWELLGHKDWDTFCQKELLVSGELLLALIQMFETEKREP